MAKIIKSRNNKEYLIEEVEKIAVLGDYVRKLFRVTNKTDNKTTYKGIRISHTKVVVEAANEVTLDAIYNEAFQHIEAELANDNEDNLDYFMTTMGNNWIEIGEYGEPIWQK